MTYFVNTNIDLKDLKTYIVCIILSKYLLKYLLYTRIHISALHISRVRTKVMCFCMTIIHVYFFVLDIYFKSTGRETTIMKQY